MTTFEEACVPLIADRFIRVEDGRVIDLATGNSVVLRIESTGEAEREARWAVRCDALQKVQHRALAELVDWGPLGERKRFEAWRCGEPWRAAGQGASTAAAAAGRFLGGCGLTGNPTAAAMRVGARGPVWLPDADAGYPASDEASSAAPASLEDCGLLVCDRRAFPAAAEVLGGSSHREPQVLVLFGPPGSGKSMLLRELARQARREGLIPVAADLVPLVADHCIGRGLCVIDDGSRGGAWPALLRAAIGTPQPHVVLVSSNDEPRGLDAVALEPLAPEILLAAVRPPVLDKEAARRLRHAATQAHGWPGHFASVLGLSPAPRGREAGPLGPTSRLSRAAEESAVYTVGDTESDDGPGASSGAQIRSSDTRSLRNALNEAVSLAENGRHVRGIRQMREAIGGLARRHDWASAGHGTVALASTLMRRGHPDAALRALDDVRRFSLPTGDPTLIEIAAICAEAWTDRAKLDKAESVVGAALVTARVAGDTRRIGLASLALARCLFWQGRYAEAEAVLNVRNLAPAEVVSQVRARCLSARVAIGRRTHAAATTFAAEARALASAGPAGAVAAAACTTAFVHLAANDLDAVERDVGEALAAAHKGHVPLLAVRARLLRAEADRRRGSLPAARAATERLASQKLPELLRARLDLLRLLIAGGDSDGAAERLELSTGLRALALYRPETRGRVDAARDAAVDETVAILNLCQSADDSEVLKEVCVRVRRSLRATSVGIFAAGSANGGALIGDGPRMEGTIAARAAAMARLVAPHHLDDRLEAAAPIKYGGAVIGALAVRWAIGRSRDVSNAGSLLTMAAAAAAPAVAGAVSRLAADDRRASSEDILGVSPSIVSVRQAIARAAAAPYAVLIEGESGSGKELVARAVHRGSSRRSRPFCTLNCAALPDDLVETELFGHARGAFTGAVSERVGVFEQAHGGTLFLDEVGDLSARAQAKLLRVVQEGELRRVGENVARRIDVRIVAATNRRLRDDVAAGRFRLDLLYRLDVIHIDVPPLRERREDIEVLLDAFWQDSTTRVGSRASLGVAARAQLARYDWPGNVRELQNVLAALAVRSPKRGVVPPTALPAHVVPHADLEPRHLSTARKTFDERFVRAALTRTGGSRSRAAADLGVSRQGLAKLMKRLGIGG